MIRCIVFDFDGTLVDSNAVKRDCFDRAIAGLGEPRARTALTAALRAGGDRYTIFGAVAQDLWKEPTAAASEARKLATAYSRCCANGVRGAPPRRGFRSTFVVLRRRGVPLYINSATPRADLLPLLRARGMLGCFTGVHGAPGDKVQNLRAVMRTQRLRPHQVAMIGDGADDLAAARATRCRFVAIAPTASLDAKTAPALPDLRRLRPLLQQRFGLRHFVHNAKRDLE
jgi:phosphoglycolate phosphatase